MPGGNLQDSVQAGPRRASPGPWLLPAHSAQRSCQSNALWLLQGSLPETRKAGVWRGVTDRPAHGGFWVEMQTIAGRLQECEGRPQERQRRGTEGRRDGGTPELRASTGCVCAAQKPSSE